MGTNYYWHTNCCDKCGRGDEPKHIGKSSGGWCFSLNVYPEQGIRDLGDWTERWAQPGTKIVDEYGDTQTPARMLSIVTERSWNNTKKWWMGYADEADFHRQNHSESGPNGLLRHRIDGQSCIKHGEGTWDCLLGEFS